MIDAIQQVSQADARLASLLDEAREYAQIYHLAKERKKGCEGTGELMPRARNSGTRSGSWRSTARRKDIPVSWMPMTRTLRRERCHQM